MARMVVTTPEYTKTHYKLPKLKEIEEYVVSVVQVNIPFNNPITGFCVRSSKSSFRPQ
jgi:homocitrate synthase